MPKISDMLKGNYLSKEDALSPRRVTIAGVHEDNLAKDGEPPELRWILDFEDGVKSLVLNITNIQLAATICDSKDTDDWVGHQVVVYTDPTVQFHGKVVGGLRLRAPKKQAAKKPPPAEDFGESDDLDEADVPF